MSRQNKLNRRWARNAETRLRAVLESAAEYEELYNALISENEELAAREQLAAEEAERLGIQNAHLIGHGNGGQKISYVESVRREMALTKHVRGRPWLHGRLLTGRSWSALGRC